MLSKIKQILNIKKENLRTFFIGVDKETGGLNDANHDDDQNIPVGSNGAAHYAILQIAVIVYDANLKQLGEPIDIIIHHSKEHLDKHVGEWSKKQFKDTLMIQCPESTTTLKDAEKRILEHFADLGITADDQVYMLGNSIRLDFEFMSSQMKKLKKIFQYRLIDVSSFNVLLSSMYGSKLTEFEKKGTHDALTDIRESKAELDFYTGKFFVPLEQVLDKQLKNTK